MNYAPTIHQQKQIEVIDEIERQVKNNALQFSTVSQTENYADDPRMCITSVHFPGGSLRRSIEKQIIEPLKAIDSNQYYYPTDTLHMTIKNIRVVADPPPFTDADIETAKKVFSSVIPTHKKYQVYFYRLLLFQNNLALIGTTDPELDSIYSDLDIALKEAGLPDDKKYINSQFIFSNMSLIRFRRPVTDAFKEKVEEISKSISFDPYTVDSVTLVTSNAVMMKRTNIETWNLII